MFKQLKVAFTAVEKRRRAAWFSTAAASTGAIVAIAATSALGAAGAPGIPTGLSQRPKPPLSGAAAFMLPPTAQCVKGGRITVELRKVPRVRWVRVVVSVNGRRLATIQPSQVNRPVQIGGLPAGSITLSISARTSDRRSVTAARHYHSCATKLPKPSPPPKSTAPKTPKTPTPPSSTPKPTPTPPAPSTVPQPGVYLSGGDPLFYVSPDQAHVQDVARNTSLSCSTGGSLGSAIAIEDIPVEADGSFKTTQVESGIFAGKPVTVTVTFNGNFAGTEASGSYREDVAYEDGSGKTCTTNTQSWSAGLYGSQGSQLLAPPQPGVYLSGGDPLFYVSPDQAHVQDVARNTSLTCSTGASLGSSIAVADIEVEGESTFRKTQVETGLISGKPVKVTTTFNGHFHGLDGYGNQRAAGSYREDVVFEDGSGEVCTTNTQSWSAGLYGSQGSQLLAPPQPGVYLSGGDPLFYVSPDQAHVQDVARNTSMTCSTGASLGSSIAIEDIPVEADGSFKTTQIESGIFAGKPVTVTVTFKGHFHGLDGYGNQRAAGTYREDVAYEDGSGKTCTTNTQSWSAGWYSS